jgi:hypothetical protein
MSKQLRDLIRNHQAASRYLPKVGSIQNTKLYLQVEAPYPLFLDRSLTALIPGSTPADAVREKKARLCDAR